MNAAQIWSDHQLPPDLSGLSFVDVGCWEGAVSAEAVRRGADHVLGLDYCTSPDLIEQRARTPFDFIQMDVFSEKFLQLPEYDIVYSAGVLYHTENPLSFVHRLRKLCKLNGWLYIETTLLIDAGDLPLMIFHPGRDLDDNPSNWWSPNERCLHALLTEAGFRDVETTFRVAGRRASEQQGIAIGRICVRGRAANTPARISQKVLPRRPSYMPDAPGAGNRMGVAREL